MSDDEELLSNPEYNVILNGLIAGYWQALQTATVVGPDRIDLDGPPAPGGQRRLLPGFARVSAGGGAVEVVELRPHCDAETLLLCDRMNADIAASDPADRFSGSGLYLIDELAELLAFELNEHEPRLGRTYPGTAEVVPTYVHYGEQDAGQLAREQMGEAWVAAHDPAVAREVAERTAARAAAQAGPEAPLPAEARHDRAALAAWLARRGVEPAERIAHEIVTPGFRLVPPADGQPTPRTRIGGSGLLPPGASWPTTGPRDRPLDFLAIVDLAELTPTVAGGTPLPEAGCLLFYADLGPEQEAAGGAPRTYGWFGEPTPNEEGAGARVLWVAPGEEPVDAAAPRLPGSEAPQPPSHRVARHELVIFDTDQIGVELGFDHHLEYRPLSDASFETRSDGSQGWVPRDWVLGGATNVDELGGTGVPNPALLLRLESVDFQDAGSIEFRIPFDALERGDWSRASAQGESC